MNSLVDIFYESFQDYSYEKIKETYDEIHASSKVPVTYRRLVRESLEEMGEEVEPMLREALLESLKRVFEDKSYDPKVMKEVAKYIKNEVIPAQENYIQNLRSCG